MLNQRNTKREESLKAIRMIVDTIHALLNGERIQDLVPTYATVQTNTTVWFSWKDATVNGQSSYQSNTDKEKG